jgi:hypothetical protein
LPKNGNLQNLAPFGHHFGFTRPSQKDRSLNGIDALGRVILRSFSEGGSATEGVTSPPSGVGFHKKQHRTVYVFVKRPLTLRLEGLQGLALWAQKQKT